MSGSSLQPRPDRAATAQRLAVVGAYGVLGIALFWSRLFHLGHSFWTDEIFMVENFVRAGPREILFGPYLNHELMALLSWMTTSVAGDSEIALRLLSAVPFVAGVVLVTAWLHRRLGPLSAVLFLFLATVSPVLLDITRQARGYGLAFFAMSVLIVAALEATRTGRSWAVVAMCAAGVAGTWTLPQFGFAFVATGAAVVVIDRCVRIRTALGLVVSVAAIVAWYVPHSGNVQSAPGIEDGVRIVLPWLATAPIDQILLPALLWIDGTALVAGLVWLPLVLAAVIVAASSPFLRERSSALILCSGPVVTVVALWLTKAYVIPRYLSFLLVPLFILVATGAASILGRITRREAAVRTIVVLAVIAILAIRFTVIAPDVVSLPREAHRDAAEVIESRGSPTTPVLAYMRHPGDLEFYLDTPVQGLESRDVAESVCGRASAVFYVMQSFALEDVSVPCLSRPDVEHYRFRQYTRGEMNVWFVPGRPSA
jgi:hypothetical protein